MFKNRDRNKKKEENSIFRLFCFSLLVDLKMNPNPSCVFLVVVASICPFKHNNYMFSVFFFHSRILFLYFPYTFNARRINTGRHFHAPKNIFHDTTVAYNTYTLNVRSFTETHRFIKGRKMCVYLFFFYFLL